MALSIWLIIETGLVGSVIALLLIWSMRANFAMQNFGKSFNEGLVTAPGSKWLALLSLTLLIAIIAALFIEVRYVDFSRCTDLEGNPIFGQCKAVVTSAWELMLQ